MPMNHVDGSDKAPARVACACACGASPAERRGEVRGLLILIAVLLVTLACAGYVLASMPEAMDAIACAIHHEEDQCRRTA
jgi:hypothetical protein